MHRKLLSKSSSWFLLLDLQTTLHRIETEASRGPQIRGMANAMRIEIIPESCIHQIKWICQMKSSIYPFYIHWAWNVTISPEYLTSHLPRCSSLPAGRRSNESRRLYQVTSSDTFIIWPQGVPGVPDDAGGHDGVDDGYGPHHDQHGLVQEAEDELLVWLGAELEADGPGGPEAAAGHAHVGSARVSGPRPRQAGVDGAGARVN